MRELRYIKVKIEPLYYMMPNGKEDKQLSIDVEFDGREYHDTEVMWPSDAISVLDYCFDRAKRSIRDIIERESVVRNGANQK